MNGASSVVVLLALVMLVSVGCGAGTEPSFVRPSFASTRFSLANGLDVVLQPDPAYRAVSVNVRYEVGARHDPEGASGLAHLVEHLMFRTKVNGSADAFTVLDQTARVLVHAATRQDATGYYDTVTTEYLPTALFVEAARMARPLDAVDERTFEAERDLVRKERREGIDDVSYGNLDILACALLFEGGPYGRPIVGTPEDLARLTLADARQFANAHYRPNNATIVIAGGFDPRATTALVHELFDAIPAAPLPADGIVRLARSRASVRRIVPTGAAAPAVVVAWVVPAAGREDWPEIALAADLLHPELKRRLDRDASRVRVDIEQGDAASVLVVAIELAPGARPASVTEAIDAVLDDLANDRIARERIDQKRRRFIDAITRGLEDPRDRAMAIQTFLVRYNRADGVETDLNRIAATRSDDIAKAVDTYLRKGRRVTLEARPDANAPKAGLWPATLGE